MPWIHKERIYGEAEGLAERYHPALEAPIPVEFILESNFGISIVIAENLRATIGCPAYTSWSARQIVVDEYMSLNEVGWYNFSLAHELGHLELHPQIFRRSGHRTRGEYEAFWRTIPEDVRLRMEKQAQLFAGAFLAPTKTITMVADECVEQVRRAGIVLTPDPEVYWPYIWKGMADRLQVNELTAEIRFRELGLISRYF